VKDPFATLTQGFQALEKCRRNRDSAFRVSTLRAIDFPLIQAALHMKNIALEIRPLDRDGFSDAQSGHCQEQHQRRVGFRELFSNGCRLRRTENVTLNSSSGAVFRPWQLYSSAEVFL
jgi:hypothetical protein